MLGVCDFPFVADLWGGASGDGPVVLCPDSAHSPLTAGISRDYVSRVVGIRSSCAFFLRRVSSGAARLVLVL